MSDEKALGHIHNAGPEQLGSIGLKFLARWARGGVAHRPDWRKQLATIDRIARTDPKAVSPDEFAYLIAHAEKGLKIAHAEERPSTKPATA